MPKQDDGNQIGDFGDPAGGDCLHELVMDGRRRPEGLAEIGPHHAGGDGVDLDVEGGELGRPGPSSASRYRPWRYRISPSPARPLSRRVRRCSRFSPLLFSRMIRAAFLEQRKAPVRFPSMILFQTARSVSITESVNRFIPTLLMRISRPPNWRTAVSKRFSTSSSRAT